VIARSALACALTVVAVVSMRGAEAQDDAPIPDASETSSDESSADEAGFGDLDTSVVETDEAEPRTVVSLTLRADSAIWTERLGTQGLAKLRFTADPRSTTRFGDFRIDVGARLEGDAAYLVRRSTYDRATIDTYAWVVRSGETFVAWERPNMELATGARTIAWGHGEALAVVDLLGPRDLREPGLTDIDDARVPVFSTRASFFRSGLRGEIIAVHQAYFRLVPPPLGTFSPIRAALLRDPELVALGVSSMLATKDIAWDQRPRPISRGSQSVAARVVVDRGAFSFGGYAAWLMDPQGVARLPDAATFAEDRFSIALEHRRFGMLALSASAVQGPIVVYAEAALDIARPVNVLSDVPELLIERRTLVRWLGGGRYTNDRGGVLSLEYAQGTLHEPGRRSQPDPLVPTSMATVVSRYEHAFGRERFRFGGSVAATGRALRGGVFGRVELSYQPRDAVRLTAGYAVYLPTDEPSAIRGFERHDRAMIGLRWDDSWGVGRRN